MGIGKLARLARAVIEDQAAQFPKWARIVGVRPERGGLVTLDLEIHYGWAEPFIYSGCYPARARGRRARGGPARRHPPDPPL
jgi:hypothetical protein